ncbi:Phosphofructokinase, related [Neospora caninum Liverpool]|uniref:Probable ATP-dependent 6-phosphofructokinase n=1 Tax=Neospora caninum (strain Liverpool) TaxID=572307 RepID=F0VDW9_NEOCL|nr:Phosphofructokinase, related [Neospora caninum Liverpool]CBZ51912.1 Phosphofructokinase, related [Neospora caninum Liverpool]CEL65874.1 TPA: Phosphofructokinase, related [Neospora caninum Liverpool]|eukprot:XP_003881945.1 Phosphofructokinase, related [Neospora caninum Liverpool]
MAYPSGKDTEKGSMRRGRSLLVVTNDNQYTLSSAPPEVPEHMPVLAETAPRIHAGGPRPVRRLSFRKASSVTANASEMPCAMRLGSSLGGASQSFALYGSVYGPSQISRDMSSSSSFPVHQREQRARTHLHSADLFDRTSPVQKARQAWTCTLPTALDAETHTLISGPALVDKVKEAFESGPLAQSPEVQKKLEALFPATWGFEYTEVAQGPVDADGGEAAGRQRVVARIGIILSGGPAPGGHNVIAGLHDFVKSRHPDSVVFGFMGGLDGVMNKKYKVLTDELMNQYRNQGGFDMLWSGRGKVNGEEDLKKAKEVCESLELHGLVLVGGDGSNSNAALLAEYFQVHLPSCAVVGVPKTIDGDLKSPLIEASFGFDTAAKTYSELIGNLCTDINSSQTTYHFVRVMGRSASHLVLECAMQTRPNLVFIGEEVDEANLCLADIVKQIADLVVDRLQAGKRYGIILLPEGLIEFIPEMKVLIKELNEVLSANDGKFSPDKLTRARSVWDYLPEMIQDQLMMDREATGYIQVAKIATERLLILLLETELQKRGHDPDKWSFMPHYFGYEGRCAMPSNFDANYCYSLGYTAGVLAEKKKNGYMSIVRNLDQHPSLWTPAGVPFTKMMYVKQDAQGKDFPAIVRSLVSLDGPLFKVFCEVRDEWKLKDLYRVPGPIQFAGVTADEPCYAVMVPSAEDLLAGNDPRANLTCTCGVVVKDLGTYSSLQQQRLLFRPAVPPLCQDMKARARPSKQMFCKDPYTQRQVLMHYPYLSNSSLFFLHDVSHDKYIPPIGFGLRVGLVFISRQSPGVANVLWGLHERLKLVQGKCIAFFGLNGLVDRKFIQIEDRHLELFKNQGGCELIGRSTSHCLGSREMQEKVRQTCEAMNLDGLVIPGSAFAMSEAALLSEYFLAKQCRTSVVGIPATGSNNLSGELIEACIGFDSSTKVYASLIGNVLTDAASMPKYWHFVRLMGRQPSHEVLECALQTHPNFVIIAEEYGAADKTLLHVVQDIADVVCQRAEMGRNFGTVLIPDALLMHLPNMKILLAELRTVLKEADAKGEMKKAQQDLNEVTDMETCPPGSWGRRLTPWSAALFRSFPKFIRRELLQVDMGEIRFERLETEELLAQMVKEELEYRKSVGRYCGKFQAVTHFFGYQGRSSMPSQFDANLAFAYGHLASILVESGVTGHCCSIRGLCGPVKDWRLGSIPFVTLMKLVPTPQDNPAFAARGPGNDAALVNTAKDIRQQRSVMTDLPIIPSAEVNLDGKAYRWMKTAAEQWALEDRFCNPGPIQFTGPAAQFFNRELFEEQAEYYDMVCRVERYTNILKQTCTFGVSDSFLKNAYVSLTGLLMLAFHPDELTAKLPALSTGDFDADGNESGAQPTGGLFARGADELNVSVSRFSKREDF